VRASAESKQDQLRQTSLDGRSSRGQDIAGGHIVRMIQDVIMREIHLVAEPRKHYYIPVFYLKQYPRAVEPSVLLALWTLVRLGCIRPADGQAQPMAVSLVNITPLGSALFEACTIGRQPVSRTTTIAPTIDGDFHH
jgi:hypothetical protein